MPKGKPLEPRYSAFFSFTPSTDPLGRKRGAISRLVLLIGEPCLKNRRTIFDLHGKETTGEIADLSNLGETYPVLKRMYEDVFWVLEEHRPSSSADQYTGASETRAAPPSPAESEEVSGNGLNEDFVVAPWVKEG